MNTDKNKPSEHEDEDEDEHDFSSVSLWFIAYLGPSVVKAFFDCMGTA